MSNKFEMYKCDICGNVIEIVNEGAGELVCCGSYMKLVEPKNEETMQEKHKPVIEADESNIKIKVGEIAHPMTKEHHINFIEAISLDGKYLYRKYLEIDEAAQMNFFCKTTNMKARELCNIHGLFETVNE